MSLDREHSLLWNVGYSCSQNDRPSTDKKASGIWNKQCIHWRDPYPLEDEVPRNNVNRQISHARDGVWMSLVVLSNKWSLLASVRFTTECGYIPTNLITFIWSICDSTRCDIIRLETPEIFPSCSEGVLAFTCRERLLGNCP